MSHSKRANARRLGACCVMFFALQLVNTAARAQHFNSRAAQSTKPSGESLRYHFFPGQGLIYNVSYSGTAQSDFRALLESNNQPDKSQPEPLGLTQSFETIVQGELLLTTLSVKKHSVVLAYKLRNGVVKLIANGQEDGNDAEKIKRELNGNIFVAIDRRGKVLFVRFDSEMSKLSQGFARGLIASTQFVLPDEGLGEPDQWESQEEGPNGRYVAQYRRINRRQFNPSHSALGAITFEKAITRYLPAATKPSPTDFEVETTITPAGSLLTAFDKTNGRLIALDGTESQLIEVAGKTVARAQTKIRLNYAGKQVLGSATFAALRASNSKLEKSAAATPLAVSISKEESEAGIARTELAADGLEKLLADLATIEAATGDKNETPIYLKFKALVYLHPESSAKLGEILATADAKGLTMRVLTGALASVGNAAAQAALVSAAKARSTDWPALSMLIPALDESSAPTPLAEDTIREFASQSPNADISSTALLTLGAMARNLAGAFPARAAKIVEWLITRIDSSSSDQRKKVLLLALGNAGSAQAYSSIAKFTTDASPELRAAAVSALRWVDSDQAGAKLINTLTFDPEPAVRLEASIALGSRRMTTAAFEAQKQALETDKDEKVRTALLRNLWKSRAAFPEARKPVETAASSDVSEDVRKAAKELLASEPKHPY